jgi:hypothetical protein
LEKAKVRTLIGLLASVACATSAASQTLPHWLERSENTNHEI